MTVCSGPYFLSATCPYLLGFSFCEASFFPLHTTALSFVERESPTIFLSQEALFGQRLMCELGRQGWRETNSWGFESGGFETREEFRENGQ